MNKLNLSFESHLHHFCQFLNLAYFIISLLKCRRPPPPIQPGFPVSEKLSGLLSIDIFKWERNANHTHGVGSQAEARGVQLTWFWTSPSQAYCFFCISGERWSGHHWYISVSLDSPLIPYWHYTCFPLAVVFIFQEWAFQGEDFL